MLTTLISSIVGNKNDREVKRLRKIVEKINAFEPSMEALSDAQLTGQTQAFRDRLEQGESLDQLLPEAFATVREASKRVMGMRHFDVQLIGGMALNAGKVAEMKTGEGKTLVATLAAYLNALPGLGVHVVTVNDYLATRDANWMRPLYEFLGMSVGIIHSQQDANNKKEAYDADITYGTNNEYGFDYLRDNMAFSPIDRYQRGQTFAIVDEVDSILIDEARTPLIISGPAEDSSERYIQVNKLIPSLEAGLADDQSTPNLPGVEKTEPVGDYLVSEKDRTIELTEIGHEKVEQGLIELGLLTEGESLYSPANLPLLHHVHAGIRAHALFHKDVDYIVQKDEVIIVDEHTGRTMPGRRWSEGLHQAVEAKEGLKPQRENQTLASTTFQNYFRLYDKLSGMTGTADTEAYELNQIYALDVLVIPTNRPITRKDHNDLIYLNEEDKYLAVIDDVVAEVAKKRPVLVGTASVEASERLSAALKKAKIEHNVLNAKQHEREAQIIADAGLPGAVTIATNMAGRGTDIVLGGKWEAELAGLEANSAAQADIASAREQWLLRHQQVKDAGGLHIVGTERHESRRIDNQLRGRAGRQGDPGSSRFFLSLEDPLMRIFMPPTMKGMLEKMGMKPGESIDSPLVTRSIEKAQRKVEGRNFDMRKQLLEYDDVANDQRTVVYNQRNELMDQEDIRDTIENMRQTVLSECVDEYLPPMSLPEQWRVPELEAALARDFDIKLALSQRFEEDKSFKERELRTLVGDEAAKLYADKEQMVGEKVLRQFEKQIMLQVLDQHWKDHLHAMDYLRQGIHLRGYAAKNPKQEYKREAFELFQAMLNQVRRDTVRVLSNVKVRAPEEVAQEERLRRAALAKQMQLQQGGQSQPVAGDDGLPKVGRNDPCPCGSGKKYKQCHGRLN